MKKLFLFGLLLGFLPLFSAKADIDFDRPLDLKFTAVDGRHVDLSKMRGKVVLIDFWATWCGPCVASAPDVVALYHKFHAQGLEVVGISVDTDKDAFLAFTKENGMVWPQYYDGQGWETAIRARFGIRGIPAMFLVGKDGKIVNPDGGGDLSGLVEKLVNAP